MIRRSAVSIGAILLMLLLSAEAKTTSSDCGCVRQTAFEVFSEAFFRESVTEANPGCRDKWSKGYPLYGPASRKNGIQPLITTFYSVHTRESFPVFERPAPEDEQLRYFFRCRGFGVRADIDHRLVQIMLSAARRFEAGRTEIVSGFRSEKMNDTLMKRGRRVAMESRHMRGQAIDFRLDTVDARALGRWLREHFDGGVGIYPTDNFVHVDVGPRRMWKGK